MQDFLQDLRQRGQLQDHTEGLEALLAQGSVVGYIGFDPTAASLGIGNLVTVTLLQRFQAAGHKAVVLVGGATGRIGDPSGKDQERQLLDYEALERNIAKQTAQLRSFLNFEGDNPAILVNNYDFYKDMPVLNFLRDVGKQLTVNYMMSKDSVKNRMETGISFTEFSYQLIQGYDFLHMHQTMNCMLQMGGGDQWGNITTGLEMIRKSGSKAYGLTCPLLTKADGKKFGKSEAGNVFLDAEMTSVYQFYQFWLNVADADLAKLLRTFSMKPMTEIEALEAEHAENPNALKAILAEEMTVKVHGQAAFEAARTVSQVLFSKKMAPDYLASLDEGIFQSLSQEMPCFEVQLPEAGADLPSLLAELCEVLPSKAEVRRAVKNNAISLNAEKISDSERLVSKADFIRGQYLFVENGKKNKYLLRLV